VGLFQPTTAPVALLKKTFHGDAFVVMASQIRAFAAATNDCGPGYQAMDPAELEIPAIFPVRYHIGLAKQFLTEPLLSIDLLRLVHGEQEMTMIHPLRVGDIVTPKLNLVSVEEKEAGTLLSLRYRLFREGVLVHETLSRYFVRAPDRPATPNTMKHEPEITAPDTEVTIAVRDDQSIDYAAASLDHNPIHLDDAVAQAVGFKSKLLHGLCTLAFASQALIATYGGGDPKRLHSIRARFAKPVFMGERLVTRLKSIREDAAKKTIKFEMVNQDQIPVLTHGLAVITA